MATLPRIVCDICRSDRDVSLLTVVLEGRRPWEADICTACYEDVLGPLSRKGRNASKSNVRPQHKMEKLDESLITL
jgi:hypothetical protein